MNYHIALCGAGGTGKGTLMKELMKHLGKDGSILPIPSPVQPLSKLMDPDSKNYKDFRREEKKLMQYAVVAGQMHAESTLASSGFGFIAERSVIDFLSYFFNNSARFSHEEISAYSSFIYSYLGLKPYDLIVRVPIEFEPKDKKESSWKERDMDAMVDTEKTLDTIFEQSRLDVSKIKDGMYGWVSLEEYTGIPNIKVHGTPQERAQQVMQKLKEMETAQ